MIKLQDGAFNSSNLEDNQFCIDCVMPYPRPKGATLRQTNRERETERKTERQRERDKDRERDRDRRTDRQRQ